MNRQDTAQRVIETIELAAEAEARGDEMGARTLVEEARYHQEEGRRMVARIEYTETTYRSGGATYLAIEVREEDINSLLGRDHDGSAEDDHLVVDALLASGATEWVRDAPGYLDEGVWGLIGPQQEEEEWIGLRCAHCSEPLREGPRGTCPVCRGHQCGGCSGGWCNGPRAIIADTATGTALVDAETGCPACPHEDWSHLTEADVPQMCESCREHWGRL